MILLVGAEKGGTGKTTLAVNLAALRASRGYEVLLLDADPQKSMSFWSATRDSEGTGQGLTCVQKTGDLRSSVMSLAPKFDDVIIDTGGRDSEELRSALLVANLLLIPIKPSQYDLWSLAKMAVLVDDARTFNPNISALATINLASPHPGVSEVEEAKIYLADYKQIKVAESVLRDRIAFRRSTRQGQAVGEMKAIDAKANLEITSLYQEVFHDRAQKTACG
jgi:chromosome partitioning protein